MFESMLFENVGGFFVPCLSTTHDGHPREIDGVRVFEARDVALVLGLDEASVREAHGLAMNDRMTASAPAVLAAEHSLRKKYSHLDDLQYGQFRKKCQQMSVSPWGKQVWTKLKWNEETGEREMIIQLTADGFYAVAMRSGDVLSILGPEWCGKDYHWRDVWLEDEPPHAARVSVKRRGMNEPISMVALWKHYAPAPTGRDDDFWVRMPSFMLGKCAATAAIRRAFAEQLDGVYGPEEMQQAYRRPSPERVAEAVYAPDVAPDSPQQFRLALINMGLGIAAKREAVIEDFRHRFRPLYTQNMRGWYQAVIAEIARDPEAYGIVEEVV